MPDTQMQEEMMGGIPPDEQAMAEEMQAETDKALNTLAEQEQLLDESTDALDAEEDQVTTIDIFENFAGKEEVDDYVQKAVQSAWSNLATRDDIEAIWKKNDLMYRVKPEELPKGVKNRANEAHGVYCVGVNQLTGMAYKIFTDNLESYGYEPEYYESEDNFPIIKKNAEILTRLLHKAMGRHKFKRELRKAIFQAYNKGTVVVGIPWESEKQVIEIIRGKKKGDRKIEKKTINIMDLPGYDMIEVDNVYVDPDIDSIDRQHAILIKDPLPWNDLFSDSEAENIKLPSKDDDSLRQKVERYRENVASLTNNHKNDRADNAGRELIDRHADLFKHWVIWIMLPIDPDTGKIDENGQEYRYRVRILGDPSNCEILEVRRNPFPDGVPLLKGNQSEDDIGFYHISLGEKVESHFDQLSTAINQMTDNRSKNTRRPIVYDPVRLEMDKYDFGHSNAVPCTGDPRTVFTEMQLTDMTGTIMNTIIFNEQKIKEIMNTTDPVLGVAMGGRTSASEYQGAQSAATTPIYADLAAIEEDLIGGYMRKFKVYVNNYMNNKEIAKIIGPDGMEYNFDFIEYMTPKVKAVIDHRDKMAKMQFYMQLLQLTHDERKRNAIILRMAELAQVENPHELIPKTAQDQAVKAALWENTAMLQYGQQDSPELGEDHESHLHVHRAALIQARHAKNENADFLAQHINETESLKRQEQVSGGMNPLSATGQQQTGLPPDSTPGEQSGQEISAVLGAQQGATPGAL